MGIAETEPGQTAEVARLRGRVADLEARLTELQTQLVEVEDWANRSMAAAQERLYWLDRWHIDLNRLMERPGASEFRAILRAARAVYRRIKQLSRSVSSKT
jgi:cob(I)alamin adenosyltransferase